MMIGYVEVDVPVGMPQPLDKPELRPAAVRASQNALQAIRRMTGGDAAKAKTQKPATR
jgi:hypothetical protein